MRYHQLRSSIGNRGLAPLILIIIIVVALAALGGGYFAVRSTPLGAKLGLKPATSEKGLAGETTAGGDAIDNLSVTAPVFDYSTSTLPELKLSAANPGAPGAVSTSNLFPSLSLDTDFDYSLNLNVALPTVEFDVTPAAPAGETPAAPDGEQPADGGSQGGTTPSASNCAQFSSVPSCSYVGDPNGKTLCEACKAAGF